MQEGEWSRAPVSCLGISLLNPPDYCSLKQLNAPLSSGLRGKDITNINNSYEAAIVVSHDVGAASSLYRLRGSCFCVVLNSWRYQRRTCGPDRAPRPGQRELSSGGALLSWHGRREESREPAPCERRAGGEMYQADSATAQLNVIGGDAHYTHSLVINTGAYVHLRVHRCDLLT